MPCVIIADANVIIHYQQAGRLDILSDYSDKIMLIQIPDVIIEEINDFDEEDAEFLGFEVLDIDLSIIVEAEEMTGATSSQDNTCFIVARDNDAICLTADKPLCNLCRRHSVEFKRSLKPIIELSQAGHMTKENAINAARLMCDNDSRLGDAVFQKFCEIIR